MKPRRHCATVLVLLMLACLTAAGCATVPTSTPAEAVDDRLGANEGSRVADPTDTNDPYSVPGQFARASANPTDDHAAARAYLTDDARGRWSTQGPLRIIDDGYDAVDVNVNYDAGIATLALRAKQIGTLQADGSFRAEPDSLRVPLELRRRADGQWRISDVPSGVLVPKAQFGANYVQRKLYFYDPTMQVLVPDLRWVKNERRPMRLANQLMDLLLSGPSRDMEGAVRSAVPGSAAGPTTVSRMDDTLVVDLNQIGDQGPGQRQQIYQQVSRSLESVFGPIQIQADGQPLYAEAPAVRPGVRDGAPDSLAEPDDADGGVVVVEGSVRELDDGGRLSGPAGSGAYQVTTAGQSTDGEQLAVISDAGRRPVLRVGGYGAQELQRVNLRGRDFTQPSWGLRNPKRPNGGGEVWTVVDGKRVVRVVGDQAGVWTAQTVQAPGLTSLGRVSQLRLSRDGARFAAIVDGRLVLGSVRREPDSISLGGIAVLGGDPSNQYVDVAWRDQAAFVVVRNNNGLSSVTEYSADGLLDDPYSSANLTPPLSAITAAPGRPVLVMDTNGMWAYNIEGRDWRSRPSFGPNMVPLYPG